MSNYDPLEFSGSWLRDLIERQNVLTDNYIVPSALRLHAIAERLNLLRALVHIEEIELRNEDILPSKAMAALATLADVLPQIQEKWEEKLSYFRDLGLKADQLVPLKDLENNHRHLETIIESVVAAQKNILLRPAFASVPMVHCWHDFAAEVANDFRDAVLASNPGLRILGNSNNGPVARFLVAVAPHVTGEKPNTEAVARFLRRASEGDKPN